MTLYDLMDNDLALRELLDKCESSDLDGMDDVVQTLRDSIIQNENNLSDKLEAYAKRIRMLEAFEKACKAEMDQLKAKASVANNKASRMKAAVKMALESLGETKVQAGVYVWSIQANGGLLPLVLDENKSIPSEYLKYEPDTTAIRESLDAGVDLSFARFGDRGTGIRLK